MLKVLELFAGIGACSKALTNLGIEHEIVDAVEIDKYAIKSFNAVHGTNFEPQDITKWDKDIECDLIMHGSPCQDFSVAGKQAGGDKDSGTRSSLMYETLRIVEKLKPKYVIWENVKNLLSKKHRHNFDAYLEAMEKLGYKSKYQVLNAKDYGVPQNRERVFTVSVRKDLEAEFMAFGFPEPIPLEKRLKDIIEDEVEEKYYLSDEKVASFKASTAKAQAKTDGQLYKGTIRLGGLYDKPGRKHQAGSIYEKRGIAPTLSTMQGGNLEPMIVASRGRGENNTQTLEARKDGLTNTITSVQKDNYVMCSEGVIEYRTKNKRIIETAEKSNFKKGETEYLDIYNKTPRKDITSTINAGTDSHQNNIIGTNYRIRKLTPKECWRLMGFADEDFEKAKNAGVSNSQLYKQAGNSIVVNVLMGILNNLLGGRHDSTL